MQRIICVLLIGGFWAGCKDSSPVHPHLQGVRFRIVDEVTGEPLQNHVLKITPFVYLKHKTDRISWHDLDGMDIPVNSVTTNAEGVFAMNLSRINSRGIMDIVIVPREPYVYTRFECSSSDGKTIDHIRIVRFEPGTTTVIANDVYDLKTKTLKTVSLLGQSPQAPAYEYILLQVKKQVPDEPVKFE